MGRITINPITRANGPGSVEVVIEKNKVVQAKCSGIFFRGFEQMLKDREPSDASYFTQRICGICSTVHGVAASLALEQAAGIEPPPNGTLLRNLILGADFLQNHLRHFYLLGLPDFVEGPPKPPHTPGYATDFRFNKKVTDKMNKNYLESIEYSRLAHELVALLGGKAPHQHGTIAGGSTVPPTVDIILDFKSKLNRINQFIVDKMEIDAHQIAEKYSDYYQIGSREENMIAFELFPHHQRRDEPAYPSGVIAQGIAEKLDQQLITEEVTYSWYEESPAGSKGQHPSESNTVPKRDKQDAYSFVKAPRYKDQVFEGGPLARLWVEGSYRRGVSTMDRIMARALEAKQIGIIMTQLLEQLEPKKPVYQPHQMPQEAEGIGLTGAMRGPLGHWLQIKKGRITKYQVITPTAWNFSPTDLAGQLGAVEQALIGTPIMNEKEPVEIGRVIRAFDVCFSCSTHVLVADKPLPPQTIIL